MQGTIVQGARRRRRRRSRPVRRVIVLEAMKMENHINAEMAGTVAEIRGRSRATASAPATSSPSSSNAENRRRRSSGRTWRACRGWICHLVVDAFTSEPFRGNPAGVCFLDEERPDAWMASVAAEMKHAETAFVRARDDGGYGLRWFTPETEVDLCGHATLASAHALWDTGRLDRGTEATFHTRERCPRRAFASRRPHRARLPRGDARSGAREPAWPTRSASSPSAFARTDGDSSRSPSSPTRHGAEGRARPRRRSRALDTDAVLVTAASDDPSFDICRVFGPRVGIPEDSVTGSAHVRARPVLARSLRRRAARRAGLRPPRRAARAGRR